MAAEKKVLAPGLYASPFSKAYWRDAARELGKVRMLAVAAILIAVRVALKSVAIPVAPPTLMINLGFFVNALGAMIFGPVVAILAAAISDTLGCILFPTGVYFFPFIFTEIAGSLIFALFLYRAPLTNLRVTLSRFCVSFFVNIVIQTPIMLLYYQMVLGKSYAIFDLPRICKNLVLFPLESLLLILFLNVITPLTYRMKLTYEPPKKLKITGRLVAFLLALLTYRMKLTYEPPKKLKITGRLVAFLLALLIVGSCATAGYAWYDYNTRNHATSLESDERAALNHRLADYLGVDDNTLVLVNVVTKTAFHDEETVTFTTYTITGEVDDPAVLWTLKNSVAKGEKYEGILTVGEKGTAVLNKADDSLIEIATEAPKEK